MFSFALTAESPEVCACSNYDGFGFDLGILSVLASDYYFLVAS